MRLSHRPLGCEVTPR